MFIKTIPQSHCMVIERWGKPVRVAHSGLRFFIPGIDKVKDVRLIWGDETNRDGIFIELSEQQLDTRPQDCFTKDNVKLSVDCVYRWRIVDPIKAIYEVDKLHSSIREAVLSEVRSFIGQNDLNFVLGARSRISEHVVASVEGTIGRWGVKLTGLEVSELKTDAVTEDAMRQQLDASRRSEAIRLEAEGRAAAIVTQANAEKTALVLKAEAQREAMQILAEGEQAYLRALADVVGDGNAAKVLVAQKTLDVYQKVSDSAANKVFMPLPALSEVVVSESLKAAAAAAK